MRDQISFADSVVIMLAIIALIVFCVRLGLALVIPLFLCWLIIFLYVKIRRLDWSKVEGYAVGAIRDGFQSVLIVMAVGALIGAWILSGTVPTLIYYGLKIISPKFFCRQPCLFARCCLWPRALPMAPPARPALP